MYKRYIILLVGVLSAFLAVAQTTINGHISDKNERDLAGGTIHLLNSKDSLHVSVTTDSTGKFEIKKVPEGKYTLELAYLGYQKEKHNIEVKKEPLQLAYQLSLIEIKLDEIVVQHTPAVSIRGDTTEFDASQFETSEYADADELVAQIPGVEIDEEGNVKAQGEDVKKIIVDGKEFFSTDPRIALKNLPAEIIEKVQIIDEKSEAARFSGFDDGQRDKVINIKTKPDRRHGYFGRTLMGKGDGNKYSGGAHFNAFNGDKRYSFNIMANNVNETGLHQQGRGRSRRGNANVQNGLSNTYAFAGNFNNSYLEEKMEVSANFNFNNSNTLTEIGSDIEYLLGARANQFMRMDMESNAKQTRNNASARIKWDIDSVNRLNFQPNFSFNINKNGNSSFGNTNKGESDPINESRRSSESENTSFSVGGSLNYMHRFKKEGRTFTVDINGNKNSNDREGLNLATTEYYLDAALDRIDTNNNRSYTNGYGSGFNSRATFSDKIGPYSRLQANYSFRNTNSYSSRETFEFLAETNQIGELRDRLSNTFNNHYNYHSGGLSYLYNKRDTLRIQVGLNYQHGIRNNHRTVPLDLKTVADFGSFLPSFTAAYYFTPAQSLEFNYNTNTNAPNINQLQDFVNNENELRITNGNPELKQEYNHSFSLRYRDINRETGRSLNSNVSFDYTNNKIINSVLMTDTTLTLFDDIILGAGGQYSVPINIDGVYGLRVNNNYGVPIDLIKSNLNLRTNLFYNRNYAEINQEKIKSTRYGFSQAIGLNSRFGRKYIFGVNYRLNANFTDNPSSTISHYKVINHNLSGNIHVEFLKNFVLTSNAVYFYNGGVNQQEGISTTLLNASLGYKIFDRNNGEIAVKGFDLLNNAQNINRQVNESAVTYLSSNTLNRYFMLTFTYNLRKFGGGGGNSEGGRGRPRSRY